VTRPWLARSTGLRERFLRWHRQHLPPWALACDLDLVEFRKVEPEEGIVLHAPVALVEVVPYGAPLPGPRWRQMDVLDCLACAARVPGAVVEVSPDLRRVRLRRLPDFKVLAEGGPEVYAAWLEKLHHE